MFIKTYQIIDKNYEKKEVKLIRGDSSDIFPLQDALALAEKQGLDLVLISETEDYPICKIMNYEKFIYQQKKAEKKKEKNIRTKEYKFKYGIGKGDIEVKANNIRKSLEKGDQVVVTLFYPGRTVLYLKDTYSSMINDLMSAINIETVFVAQPKINESNVMFTIKKNKKS